MQNSRSFLHIVAVLTLCSQMFLQCTMLLLRCKLLYKNLCLRIEHYSDCHLHLLIYVSTVNDMWILCKCVCVCVCVYQSPLPAENRPVVRTSCACATPLPETGRPALPTRSQRPASLGAISRDVLDVLFDEPDIPEGRPA